VQLQAIVHATRPQRIYRPRTCVCSGVQELRRRVHPNVETGKNGAGSRGFPRCTLLLCVSSAVPGALPRVEMERLWLESSLNKAGFRTYRSHPLCPLSKRQSLFVSTRLNDMPGRWPSESPSARIPTCGLTHSAVGLQARAFQTPSLSPNENSKYIASSRNY
jgi:hypothetical protein